MIADPPEVQFAPVNKEANDMSEILEERVSVDPHQGNNGQRDQGQDHDHDFHCRRHVQPEELRISY